VHNSPATAREPSLALATFDVSNAIPSRIKAAGKEATFLEAPNYAHLEMAETLGNPYGPNGRAALALMQLARG
jgi:hypothetical protein